MKLRCALAAALLSSFALSHADERVPAPTAGCHARILPWGSTWGGTLDAILGGRILLDRSSSQPHGFLSRVYDGNYGSLDDPTGSFLIFDTSRAVFRVQVPDWREVESLSFDALEAPQESHAVARLVFLSRGEPRDIPVTRVTVGTKNGMAHVRYRNSTQIALSDGEIRLDYDNDDFGSAFIAEITLDGVGPRPERPIDEPRSAPSRLVFWRTIDSGSSHGSRLHSLLIQVARTGDKDQDLACAWFTHPVAADGSALPLVVLPAQPSGSTSALELLGLAGRPEFALADALTQKGFAVLVVDVPRQDKNAGLAMPLAVLRSALEQVTSERFARHAGVSVDPARVGLWAYGADAALAMKASSDGRYRFVALSHPPTPELAAAEFVQLAKSRPMLIVADQASSDRWRALVQGRGSFDVKSSAIRVPSPEEVTWLEDFLIRAGSTGNGTAGRH